MKVVRAKYTHSNILYVLAPHGMCMFPDVATLRSALYFDPTLSGYLVQPGSTVKAVRKWIGCRKAKVSVFHV